MAIAESQLDTWSHQGSVSQSAATYATIKSALESPHSPYRSHDFDVFLQGSYSNDTNIYADSDVDIVIRLDSTYYSELEQLTEGERTRYNTQRNPATYEYGDFKRDVTGWLINQFGTGVTPGNKAIFVPGNGVRRDADILVSAQWRRYVSYRSPTDYDAQMGVVFWTKDGKRIVNFPKQHGANCTGKHQSTNSWFKPNVRVFKNMRNKMIERGLMQEGHAPSYFLEGMLWNVPSIHFGGSYQRSVSNALSWLEGCDRKELLCANQLYYLIRDGYPVCWNNADFEKYLKATRHFWENYY